jgi:hypothetical protein
VPKEARSCGEKWEMHLGNPEVVDMVFNETNYLRLVSECFQYANEIRIWLCPLGEKSDPAHKRKFAGVVERTLIYSLTPRDPTRGSKTPPKESIKLRHVLETRDVGPLPEFLVKSSC